MTALLSDFAEFSEKVRVRGTAKRKAHLRQKPKRDWRKIAALGALGVGGLATAGLGYKYRNQLGMLLKGKQKPKFVPPDTSGTEQFTDNFYTELRKRSHTSKEIAEEMQNQEFRRRVRNMTAPIDEEAKDQAIALAKVGVPVWLGASFLRGYGMNRPYDRKKQSHIVMPLQGASAGAPLGLLLGLTARSHKHGRNALIGGSLGAGTAFATYLGNRLRHRNYKPRK